MEQIFEWLKRTHPSRFFWSGMAIAQIVTLALGAAASLLLRGELSGTGLLIGAVIAFVVSSVLGLITIAFVQRLKRAELAHRVSEERYRALVENIREVIYRIDHDLVIRYVSPAVSSLAGYRPEELVGRPIDTVIDEADRGATHEVLRRALAGEQVHGVIRLRTREGERRWARGSARSIRLDAEVGLQGVLSDITDEKRAEEDNARLAAELEQARRLEAVGSLAGGVAHDFNNLLAGILANSSLIELDHTGGEDRESLKNIEELVNKGAELTRQLLGFARRGKYEILPSDLNRIASDTARLFQRTKREIALKLELGERLGTVEIDRTQIQQVILNLLVNAATASPPDGTVWLRTADRELDASTAARLGLGPGRYVSLATVDQGVGMDEETRQRVFEPFFTTRPGLGTGLGLASAYGIVRHHGGALAVESSPGEGTVFTLYLPRSEKPLPPEPAAPLGATRASDPAAAATILLVDDEEYVARSSRRLLERLGYRVLVASNGREALALYQERGSGVSLVILDMVMPGMGGAATFDALRELDPTVKVLLSSGYSVEGQAQEILARGCDGFIQKPYTREQLAAKLEEILGAAR